MSTGRWHLRSSVGAWSAGTMVTRRGEPGESEVMVSPWGQPNVTFAVRHDQLVRRRWRGGSVRPPRAERPKQPRRHLVFATANALRTPTVAGRPIENAVEEALRAGKARKLDDVLRVYLPGGATATVVKNESRVTGRQAWLILGIQDAA